VARPRKATDEEVFEAAYRVMMRLGPSQWTLSDIAREAGLTAGALVHRFGSKRELMLALMERFAGTAGDLFMHLRARSGSALSAVYAYGDCMAAMGSTPEMLAHHLSYLQLDLTDPDYHRLFRAQAETGRAELRALLNEAVLAGELVARRGEEEVDTTALAHAVQVTVTGSLFTWATYQDGSALEWMRRDMDHLLRPYRAVGDES
jgi:AcrR family transcriptional regulator